jgi:dienelactone hydrolase
MTFRSLFSSMLLGLCLVASTNAFAEDVTLKHGDVNLHAELRLADGKTVADGVIVMLHGTLAHNRMEIMRSMQNVMADRGYSSLAVNLGYNISDREGMMDCAALHTHRHEDAATEVGLWVDWLKGQGAERIALLGHSRGGNQIAQYVTGNPDATAGMPVILMAPATYDAEKEAASYEKSYGEPLEPVVERARELVLAGKGDEPIKGIGFVYCENATATAEAVASYYDPQGKDTPTLIAEMDRPVLVFGASADTAVPDLIEKMEPIADGERVRLEVMDGADHFFRDLWAEDVADVIDEYLAW